MKKAIIAVPYLKGTGGTETVIKNFAKALNIKNTNDGISWKLISFGGTNNSEWLKEWNRKVYNFSNLRFIQLVAYVGFMPVLIANILRKEKPDFFIATNPIIWSLAYKFRKIFSAKTKIIAWYHYSFKMKNVKRKYLKTADKFWAISSGIKDELVNCGVSPQKIDIIYNPVNTDDVNIISRTGQQNHFIYMGRIDYDGQKNVSELIKAFNNVRGNWHCDLYGSVNEETKKRLLKLATPHTKKCISFRGYYSNVWDQVHEADVLILTSKYEGLPMVLCEAISRGIFIIASNCQGIDDIVTEANGIIYSLGDYKTLGKEIEDVISKNIKICDITKIISSSTKFNYKKYKERIYGSILNECKE